MENFNNVFNFNLKYVMLKLCDLCDQTVFVRYHGLIQTLPPQEYYSMEPLSFHSVFALIKMS